MKDSISPEEKLLRLIKGAKKHEKPEEPKLIEPKKNIPEVRPSIALDVRKYLSKAYIYKLVAIFFCLSCFYLIASFIYPWFGFKKVELPKAKYDEAPALETTPTEKVIPYEFYSESIKGRQIFGGISQDSKLAADSGAGADFIKEINLLGIISGDEPQAFIEDKSTQKAYYVTKGQFIGECQVEDILDGKVILKYRGRSYELYL